MKMVWESFNIGRIFHYPRNILLSFPIFKYHFRRMNIISSDIKIKNRNVFPNKFRLNNAIKKVKQKIKLLIYMIIKHKRSVSTN